MRRPGLPGTWITLLALAIVYGIGSTTLNIELERLVERTLTPHIAASPAVAALNREIYTNLSGFMRARSIRAIGYTCIGIMILLTIVGLVAGKRGAAFLGSLGFILPIYAYFVIHMSFLAGLGILAALWPPFWGDLIHLGDIAYLPYKLLVCAFSQAGADTRYFFARLFTDAGLLILILGVLSWLHARFEGKKIAGIWIYRVTRHPQYLGWIVWSYGLMLRASLSSGIPLHSTNPGASLPWVIASLIIVCIALSEEIQMQRELGKTYEQYRASVPFLIPLPDALAKAIAAPFRLICKKKQPETGWDLAAIFLIYLACTMLLSLPFL